MCNEYDPIKEMERFYLEFGVTPPPEFPTQQMWPRRQGVFIRRPPKLVSGDDAVPKLEAVVGRWGLVPARTYDPGKQLKLSTNNARDDRVQKAFSFSGAWRASQRCIIPAEAIYEPDWRSEVCVPTRISRKDGKPLGVAGLWDLWQSSNGPLLSYTMLTINADSHALMKNMHREGKEKRMVVVLPEDTNDAWLDAPVDKAMSFLVQYPADRLAAVGQPKELSLQRKTV